ncbi:isoprenylcysteine carboxylmethyltransferase family protein [Cupriavidus basilensis]|uniref:Isoprenylcysteine carboxylmethyltransferase family protein n=1 Tax=Cupriavidus basilensis TaxID=68895 RepID=A0ABT6AKR2_9BURK|nr:isoprenylcysteine carboxylmethyltransferase family protein [Cupriavidus basilensis]MDF3832902.1 isoprenylcysteine carboxylmethyltransferase family protein [Cupriavidus basilensis]
MGIKVWFALGVEALVFAGLLFGGAGTLRWPAGWAYLILFFGCGIWATLRLARHDPALLAERMKMPLQAGQPLWDKIFMLALSVAWCAWLVLMGVDAVRLRWSAMPLWLQGAGAVLLLLSYRMIDRVLHENTFLAPVVRIQAERGHRVISSGPYAVIRHPLYAAALVFLPANALVLGSWYGLAASLALDGAIVLRTAMEDRELLRGLDGYAAYAARVRYRLIPFVW